MAEIQPSKWTYEQTSEAFDKVKKAFEIEDGRLEIIPEERYKEVYMIMGDHFTPDEPLSKAFGVTWHPFTENLTESTLRQNLSVMMVSKKTNEIMGVRISGVMKKTDEKLNVTYEPLRNVFNFMTQKDSDINFYETFGVSEAMHFFALGVHRKFRGLGLGTKLMGACVALSRELGFKAIKGEGTSAFSQRIYQKYDFEVLCELPYDQYIMNGGHTLREKTGVHDMTKVVGLKL